MFSSILIRIFDIIFSLLFILFFSPFILFITILILICENHPILFLSYRVGLHGKLFKIYKFQTMINEEVTYLGFFLRRMSLDEIPQLFNVLIGDMSLVGPRPLPEKIEIIIDDKNRLIRRNIRPGITGLAQIHYSGKKRTLEEKINLDISYINNVSFRKYLNILLLTLPTLIRRFIYNKSAKSL